MALKTDFIPASEHLKGEEESPVRHEYIDGSIYAMAGASREHNRIATNLLADLHAKLRGRSCQVSVSDLKVRLLIGDSEVFYYPAVMVTCDRCDTNPTFNQFPTIIFEVLSEATERIDRIEKFNAYKSIETLQEYVLIAQNNTEITVHRRSDRWKGEVIADLDHVIELTSLGLSISLRGVYEGVNL